MVATKTDNGREPRPEFYGPVRRARIRAIEQFRNEQHRSRRWIQLREIGERCCLTGDPRLPVAKREEFFLNTLRALLDSALAGEFLIQGRSRLLRAHPHYRIARSWLRNPDEAPAEAFVTQEELRGFLDGMADASIYTKVSRYFIPYCWIPLELALTWLRTRSITVPTDWLLHSTTSTLKVQSQRHRPAQKRIQMELVEKAPQYLDGPCDKTLGEIANMLVGKTGGVNRPSIIDAKKKALQRFYHNRGRLPLNSEN
jgi:hypothetical protein